MRMELAQLLFADDDKGFKKACERLFNEKKDAQSDDETNINKEDNRYSRTNKTFEDFEL